ncbi:MAG: hypothetical protein J5654_09040 [Victivallales bacterium]|nr:hypothetical protein [Victivallales bacterium]
MKSWFSLIFAMSLACLAADKVLIIALGDHIYDWDPPEMVDRFYASLEDKGIDAVWGVGGPLPWRPGNWKNPEYIEFINRTHAIIRKHGIKVLLPMNPGGMLSPEDNGTTLKGWKLDPKTGRRFEAKGAWDFASPSAMAEFMNRVEWYINATKPYEGYIIDEVELIDHGPNAGTQRMSQYWTSPTYSPAALESFRKYVREHNLLPEPEKVKFPVTTQEREPSEKCNLGLPAVPLDEENSSYLVEDNDYCESPLWKAWMDWRTELLTQYHVMQYKLAVKLLSDNPGWIGCFSSAPSHWYGRQAGIPYSTESGLDKYRIAAIPELDWLVCGYRNGMYLHNLKDAAAKYGKKLGGMIEFSAYGIREPFGRKLDEFKSQIERGAKCMYLYPLSNLNPERNEEKYIGEGRGWQPFALENWMECVNWLRETGRAMK